MMLQIKGQGDKQQQMVLQMKDQGDQQQKMLQDAMEKRKEKKANVDKKLQDNSESVQLLDEEIKQEIIRLDAGIWQVDNRLEDRLKNPFRHLELGFPVSNITTAKLKFATTRFDGTPTFGVFTPQFETSASRNN
ncbi:GL25477 [Drosophila persimilis]|uniref:GL25477 n=1 Tax=Drosophila persimilis TaxID=7234 RepID=B4HBG5_DROPE|nr:GL25477 [Drosophila persimilis]